MKFLQRLETPFRLHLCPLTQKMQLTQGSWCSVLAPEALREQSAVGVVSLPYLWFSLNPRAGEGLACTVFSGALQSCGLCLPHLFRPPRLSPLAPVPAPWKRWALCPEQSRVLGFGVESLEVWVVSSSWNWRLWPGLDVGARLPGTCPSSWLFSLVVALSVIVPPSKGGHWLSWSLDCL